MNIEIDPKGMEHVLELCDNMFETKLGPAMEAEVRRNAPTGTGRLKESVSSSVDRAKHALYITATGDESREGDRRYYAAYVDLGHHQVAWGHETDEIIPPTAFMRRALYRRYAGF